MPKPWSGCTINRGWAWLPEASTRPVGEPSPDQVRASAGPPDPHTQVVGQGSAEPRQGSGTLVTGTAADTATAPAVAAYPGGTVDRVVLLSSGDYEVHIIVVNWPHHVFVNKNFKVIGAE
ncbi:MAG: hypothetical protein LC797_21050 [Chloroflexi bacterium]|nr:hypothetical protein [Chloroflexota bacterium]